MDSQRFTIKGKIVTSGNSQLQDALASIYGTPERPRCLCVLGGVEMYVARHRQFVVKRMPGSGSAHHPGCPSYQPEATQSGLGELIGDAILEPEPGRIELRVDFPWSRCTGRCVSGGESREASEVNVPGRRMSLRALMHFLFERAGFNRWIPAMAGKRNQGVLRKYLLEATEDVSIKGVPLFDRLYVPEPFSESFKVEIAQRRRDKLSLLHSQDGTAPLAVVIGEFRASEATAHGFRVWIRHMPDAPLLIAAQSWTRIERIFASMFEARDADTGHKVRLILAALIRARREYTYEIDAASLMLTSEHWIPIEGIHELPLIDALVSQQRRFVKPLRYDAKSTVPFPNALLLDAGPTSIPLHIISAFTDVKERVTKEKAISTGSEACWVWRTEQAMQMLPQVAT